VEEKTGRSAAMRQQGTVVCAIVLWSDSSESVLITTDTAEKAKHLVTPVNITEDVP